MPDFRREVLSRRNFYNLLMPSLDTAVTLVEMHYIPKIVAKKLDLDMLRTVEEALNEDCSVSERRLGPV